MTDSEKIKNLIDEIGLGKLLGHLANAVHTQGADVYHLQKQLSERDRDIQALKDKLHEAEQALSPDTLSLIKETREALKVLGYEVPEGVHLLDTVIKALKDREEAQKLDNEAYDRMEKALMGERDQANARASAEYEQRKVWEASADEWRHKYYDLLEGFKALESINKMQEGMINASNNHIKSLEDELKLANTSRNLYKDASSHNYERARAAELKIIKLRMRAEAIENGYKLDNPCVVCGEQIPIHHAALYKPDQGGCHFACEAKLNAQAPQQHPLEGGC